MTSRRRTQAVNEAPLFGIEAVRAWVGDTEIGKGRPYAEGAAVSGCVLTGSLLKACVKGTRTRPYRVWVQPAEGTITGAQLLEAGLVSHARDGVRLLAKGAVTAKLSLEVAGASRAAIAAVEQAGGSVTTTYKKPVRLNRKGQPGKRLQRRKAAAEKRAAQGPTT